MHLEMAFSPTSELFCKAVSKSDPIYHSCHRQMQGNRTFPRAAHVKYSSFWCWGNGHLCRCDFGCLRCFEILSLVKSTLLKFIKIHFKSTIAHVKTAQQNHLNIIYHQRALKSWNQGFKRSHSDTISSNVLRSAGYFYLEVLKELIIHFLCWHTYINMYWLRY